MRRTIHIHPDALREIYLIPRGAAAELTKLLRALETDPTPENTTPVPGRPGRYELRALGHVTLYEVGETRINILMVEPE